VWQSYDALKYQSHGVQGMKLRSVIKRFQDAFCPRYSRHGERYERIYHVHIRKCAGTSLNKCFIKGLGGSGGDYGRLAKKLNHHLVLPRGPVVGWNVDLINKGAYFYAFSHQPYHQLHLQPNTFSFTFLRDPISRIISHYTMLKDMLESGTKHPAMMTEGSWALGDFDSFLSKISRPHLENQLYMFDENFDVARGLERLKSLSYVGDISQIKRDFIPEVAREFSLDLDYQPLRSSKNRFNPTAEQLENLKTLIATEIQFYDAAKEFFRFDTVSVCRITRSL